MPPKRAPAQIGCTHVASSKSKRCTAHEAAMRALQSLDAKQGTSALVEGLQCLTCGVQSANAAKHKTAHRNKRGHELALDLAFGEMFCTVCCDYVYDPEVDKQLSVLHAARMAVCQQGASSSDDEDLHMVAVDLPTAELIELPRQTLGAPDPATAAGTSARDTSTDSGTFTQEGGPSFLPVAPSDGFPAGLRGLNNMGHTCFMNSILQAMLHSPLLPGHYLMHGHASGGCPVSADGGHCVNCQLDGMFSEAYSGTRLPHSPAAFLHAWWMLAGSALGGYKQQDAHEFFLFILEMMAATAGKDNIASRVFGGSLRSDVICSACGRTSTTVDHFTNLSLDVPPPSQLVPPPILPRVNQHSAHGKAGAAASKSSKPLVGAARASHLKRLQRQSSATAAVAAQPTPDHSVDVGELGGRTSEDASSSPATVTAAAGEPHGRSKRQSARAPSPLQRAATDSGAFDTDSAAVEERALAGGASPSPSGTDPGTAEQDAAAAATNTLGSQTTAAAAVTAADTASHPALAGYLRWPGVSLVGCLRRFTRAEQLGTSEPWTCAECATQGEAVKQMSLLRLPPVLVLHAKRFEHAGGARAAAKKLDTFVSFPLDGLDMEAYLSSSVLRARAVKRATPTHPPAVEAAAKAQEPASPPLSPRSRRTRAAEAAESPVAVGETGPSAAEPPPGGDFSYDLFAVVCHRGTFQGGHYVCYVRCTDGGWYLCDDAYVTPVDAEAVRNCQAYMLFYGLRDLLPFNLQ